MSIDELNSSLEGGKGKTSLGDGSVNVKVIDLISDVNVLRAQLSSFGIDLSQWGKGGNKSLDDLFKEIKDGETILEVSQDGKEIKRVVNVISADVFFEGEDGLYILREDRQVFNSGETRVRDYLPDSISEKSLPNEKPEQAIIRGVQEELGIEGDINVSFESQKSTEMDSKSYPWLKSIYNNYKFKITLTNSQYNPDGYTEEQAKKTTYFIWRKVS